LKIAREKEGSERKKLEENLIFFSKIPSFALFKFFSIGFFCYEDFQYYFLFILAVKEKMLFLFISEERKKIVGGGSF